jgi:hypothetical protein
MPPWERFQPAQAAGPWTKYQSAQQQPTEPQPKGIIEKIGHATGSIHRGLSKRGLGIIQAADDLTGNNILSPEARAASQETVAKLRKEGKGKGFASFLVENIAADPLSWINPATGVIRSGAIMGATSALTDAAETDKPGFTRGRDAIMGAGAGAATGAVVKAGAKALKPIAPRTGEMKRLVDAADAEGIKLTPAQRTGSRALRGIETGFNELPLTAGKQAAVADEQAKLFNKAVLARAGIDADTATPEILSAGKQALSKQFDDISARTSVNVDDELLEAFGRIEKEATKRLGPDASKAVTSYVDDILSSGGAIDGLTYQNTRSQLGQLAKGTKDSFTAGLLKDMRDALDEAAFRSLPDADKATWQKVRKQYGAYKTVEKAMSSTGNQAIAGNISPGALATAAKTMNKNFATGAGELNELARIGAAFLRDQVGNSGTAQRQLWQNLLTGGTGAAGYAAGGPVGAVAALAAPKIAQIAYGTKPVQKYLTEGIADIPKAVQAGIAATAGTQAGKAVSPNGQRKSEPPYIPPGVKPPQSNATPLLDRITKAESGGDPNAKNPNSSASGPLQFTNDTWAQMVGKYGKQIGITLRDKNNPEAQRIMGEFLVADNTKYLTSKLGREPNDGEIYAAHFLGAPDAVKLINAQGTGKQAIMLFPRRVVADNRSIFFQGKTPRTVEQVLELLTNKISV